MYRVQLFQITRQIVFVLLKFAFLKNVRLNFRFLNRQNYQLGSLSHYLNSKVNGYQDLPDFPEVAPDPSVREVEPPKAPNPWEKTVEMNRAKKKAATESKKKATKGFDLKFNPDCHWSRAMYRQLDDLLRNADKTLQFGRDDQSGFRSDHC